MSSTAGRVFRGLTRVTLGRGICLKNASTTVRLNSVRSLALSSARSKTPTENEAEAEVNNEPMKFSTSKASHRTWRVDRSMGSQHQRPWWKVVPISLFGTAFLLWCVLREETELDKQLEKQLHEQLSTSDEETEEDK